MLGISSRPVVALSNFLFEGAVFLIIHGGAAFTKCKPLSLLIFACTPNLGIFYVTRALASAAVSAFDVGTILPI